MPKAGFKSITVSGAVYDAFYKVYENSKDDLTMNGVNSFAGYVTSMLQDMMREEKLIPVNILIQEKKLLEQKLSILKGYVQVHQDGDPQNANPKEILDYIEKFLQATSVSTKKKHYPNFRFLNSSDSGYYFGAFENSTNDAEQGYTLFVSKVRGIEDWCECMAYVHGKNCYHIKEIKKRLEVNPI